MFGLLHNCIIHPICGITWFIADTIHDHTKSHLPTKLDELAERLHAWEPKK